MDTQAGEWVDVIPKANPQGKDAQSPGHQEGHRSLGGRWPWGFFPAAVSPCLSQSITNAVKLMEPVFPRRSQFRAKMIDTSLKLMRSVN